MFRGAFLAFLVGLAIVTQECNIGDLLSLITTYEVNVTNAGTQPAYLHVTVNDASRGAYLPPGRTVSVTSFVSGKYSIVVAPWDPSQNAALETEAAGIEAKLANPGKLSPDQVTALNTRLQTLKNLGTIKQSGIGTANCTGELKQADPAKPKDLSLTATATNAGIQWSLSGC